MFPKAPLFIFALAFALLIASCGENPSPTTDSTAPSNINNHLRRPGLNTHVRYTTVTPPWPTRTEAWIDWDNNRSRKWNVQWTDSPTNPSVCTSIQDGEKWYPCLPSRETLDTKSSSGIYFWPNVPLRTPDKDLSLNIPAAPFDDDPEASTPPPAKATGSPTTKQISQGDMEVTVTSWPIDMAGVFPCEDGDSGSYGYDYTTTADGEPLSESITVACGEEQGAFIGVMYHDIEFLEASQLPPDFFDVDSARASLLDAELSSAAAQLGTVFWLGEHAGDWTLSGAEHDAKSASILYSRGDGADEDDVELTVWPKGFGSRCPNPELIPGDALMGSLCKTELTPLNAEYSIVWTLLDVDVRLDVASFPPEDVGRDDLLALAANIEQWPNNASRPLLAASDVANLIADSLEHVCPSKLREIRETRSQTTFTFDRTTGEWTGLFGSFGEIAVPDSKPVAIPVDNREEVESTLSHNAAQFVGCVVDELPPPQEGDDEFSVEFTGQDEAGLSFEITGIVDSEMDAALTFCLLPETDSCRLTGPDGVAIDFGAIEINDVRQHVLELHIDLNPEDLRKAGAWTIALDLGEGRKAQETFDVR